MEANRTPLVATGGKKNDAQGYVLERIAEIAKHRLHKDSLGLMNETINPLWNIDERKAQMIYDWARSGNFAQVQYLYNEIEDKDPTLGVCVTRRTSAVAELDWRVVRSDQRLNRNADKKLIEEQIDCVETAIAKIDNMPDALEHLALSAFRGFSAIAPVHEISGDLKHFDLLDGWNLCFDRKGQSWLWNPSATSFYLPTAYTLASANDQKMYNALTRIPREDICVVTRKREIDWPAMQIFLRLAIGERDWGRFLETYGLPPVIITMPEFTSKEDQDAYVKAAESVFEGRSGVVPYGSNISFASESRGTNPFTEFIEHQQKLIVMMATGGTLATLSEATGIGGGASNIQQDEWKRIIRADKRIISNAVNKQICEPILRKVFPGKPILAEFQLDDTPKPTPKEMLELAQAASSAGFEMDTEELSQAIGYKLTKKVEGGGLGFNEPSPIDGGDGDDKTDSKETPVDENLSAGEFDEPVATNTDEGLAEDAIVAEDTPKTPATPSQDPDPDTLSSEKGTPSTPVIEADKAKRSSLEDMARAVQTDFKPIADRIVAILALPESERPGAAVELMKDLDSLAPDDAEIAEVIRREMEKAFESQLKRDRTI